MNSSFCSFRDALLLFLWGGFVIWLDLSKQLSTFLHPSLQPYTVTAGALLIVLALFSLRAVLMKQKETDPDSHDHHHEHSCCHGHDHQKDESDHNHDGHEERNAHDSHDHHGSEGAKLGPLIFKTLVLLLPLAVVLFGQNNHYTMSTINNRGIVQDISKLPAAKASESAAPLPKTPTSDHAATSAAAMSIQVIDLLYAVQMPTYREDFEGKQVELIGQFVPLTTGNPKGNRFQVIRLFMTCCAADAKPVGATVQYDKPLKVSEMGWVKITGVPTFPMEGGRRTAVLVASKVEECPAPAEPFVY